MNRVAASRPAAVHIFPDGRMDTANTARYVGLSQKTLAMMRCQGKGPAFVKRGRVFYYQADIDAWLQKTKGRSTAEVNLETSGK